MKNEQTNHEKWQGIINDYHESNLSEQDYCQQHHLKFRQFRYWYNRLNKESKKRSAKPLLNFIPLQLKSKEKRAVSSSSASHFSLRCGQELVLNLPAEMEVKALAELLKQLMR